MEEEKENPKLDNGLDIEDDSSSEESDDEVEISDLAATELDLPALHGKLAPLIGGMELNLPDLEIGKGDTAVRYNLLLLSPDCERGHWLN
jgi:hypothetical protein